jgi:hypothetical protein
MTATFMEHFSDLKDPRDDKNKKHQFLDTLFLVIAAVISGAEGWEAIETFEEEKLEWLRKYFPFANGVPLHDCIRMVLISLSPKALQGCFARWMQAVVEVAKGEVVALTARRSSGPLTRQKAWGRFTG